ncbi:tripartite-type tricarboxylate transporter receptor subunit TctC [Neorhizobium galegae]|uniref:tripartite tricarboxylate transporter substrate binding protein n=1 Tax=Neorhizobium galegae TaxID=399 RepID=UPI002781214E|nr:tripartite tricarboxylate transporter substrate binding protein [Neorhizobium galegae]MDQ0137744.1 tripartite-type tricarboxylate transporter receptor subunit TctC [Neorhizobium galegae]
MNMLTLVGAAFAALLASISSSRAEFPDKPIQLTVGSSAGGYPDVLSRGVQKIMSSKLGQPVVILNQPGAMGALTASQMTSTTADGYSLATVLISTIAVAPHLLKVNYDADSFDYICQIYEAPMAVMVAKNSPWKSLDDLFKFAKDNPGQLLYASPGAGSINQIAMGALLKKKGVTGIHAPLGTSAAAYQAIAADQANTIADNTSAIRTYEVRPLALLSNTPVPWMPDVPTVASLGIEIETPVWAGIVAPKGLKPDVRAKLESACKAGVEDVSYLEMTKNLAVVNKYRNSMTSSASRRTSLTNTRHSFGS